MKVLLLGEMPTDALKLIEILGKLGGGEFEVVAMNDRPMQGRKADFIIVDDVIELFDGRGQLLDLVAACAAHDNEVIKPHLAMLDNRPRSKGDRHKNKRYRWC